MEEPQGGEQRAESIILVPGMMGTVREQQRDRLADALRNLPTAGVAREVPSDSLGVRRLRLETPGRVRELDVREAFWGDLRPRLASEPLPVRIVNGFTLLAYWASALVRMRFRRGSYMLVTAALSALILVLWYVAVLLLGLKAATLFDVGERFVARLPLGGMLAPENNVTVWAAAVAGGGRWFLPVSRLVDVANVARTYLANKAVKGRTIAFRKECVARVRDTLDDALRSGRYDRVTVVGHSFGATIAVDALADMPLSKGDVEIRLLTLGGSLEISGLKAPWIRDCTRALLNRPELDRWQDLGASTDWLCTATPVPEGASRMPETERVTHPAALREMLVGRTHDAYFVNPRVIELLTQADRGVTVTTERPFREESGDA